MAEHRVSMLGGPLRRYEDPAQSHDPRIRELVAALATLEPAPAPRAHFRAELRAQLVAVAPRLVSEGVAAEQTAAVRTEEAPAKSTVGRSVWSGLRLSRPLATVACTVVVLAMLLGGAVLMSKRALPGDALYSLKRASENAELALAQSPSERARLNLTFAGTRLQEVQDLLPPGTGVATVDPHTASLVGSTLSSADSDVLKAAQTLGEQAVQSNSGAPLQSMTSWAPSELQRLNDIIARLPQGSARDRALATYSLVNSAAERATALQAEAGCSCLHSAPSDQFGPIPCPVCDASPSPTAPTQPGTLPGVSAPTGTTPSPVGGGTTNATPNGTGQTAGGGGSGGAASSATPSVPTIPLPSVPIPVPSVSVGPVGIGSCGAAISIGPINLHLGSCSPSHS